MERTEFNGAADDEHAGVRADQDDRLNNPPSRAQTAVDIESIREAVQMSPEELAGRMGEFDEMVRATREERTRRPITPDEQPARFLGEDRDLPKIEDPELRRQAVEAVEPLWFLVRRFRQEIALTLLEAAREGRLDDLVAVKPAQAHKLKDATLRGRHATATKAAEKARYYAAQARYHERRISKAAQDMQAEEIRGADATEQRAELQRAIRDARIDSYLSLVEVLLGPGFLPGADKKVKQGMAPRRIDDLVAGFPEGTRRSVLETASEVGRALPETLKDFGAQAERELGTARE